MNFNYLYRLSSYELKLILNYKIKSDKKVHFKPNNILEKIDVILCLHNNHPLPINNIKLKGSGNGCFYNKISNNINNKINDELKYQVWNYRIKDPLSINTKCNICDVFEISSGNFHVAHIISKKYGGDYSLSNLEVSCSRCNIIMNTLNLHEFKIIIDNLKLKS